MAGKRNSREKASKKTGHLSFMEFAARIYMPYARARKRSWRVDERILSQHITKHFGNSRLGDITFNDIEDWLSALLASGLSPATCNRVLAVMKSLFYLAEDWEYIPASPCRKVKNLKFSLSRERHLTPNQSRQLLSVLEKSAALEALALRLIILTGARKNEILKARWENVNMAERALTIPVAKSGKTGRIYLSVAALEIIKSIPRKSAWLFPSARDASKPLGDIYYFWNKIRSHLNLKDIRIHDLRHTFASALINGGYSLFVAQKILGHADPATTMRYAHLGQRTLLEAVDAAANILRLGEEPAKQKTAHAYMPGFDLRRLILAPREIWPLLIWPDQVLLHLYGTHFAFIKTANAWRNNFMKSAYKT